MPNPNVENYSEDSYKQKFLQTRMKIRGLYMALCLTLVLLFINVAAYQTILGDNSKRTKLFAPSDKARKRRQSADVPDISSSPTVFESNRLPMTGNSTIGYTLNTRLMASVGNGHLATTVYSDTIFVNGLYSGDGFKGRSHRAAIPSPNNIRATLPSEGGAVRRFALDVEKGVFFETVRTDQVTLEQRTYAHQYYTRLLVTEVHVTRAQSVMDASDIIIDLTSSPASDGQDFVWDPVSSPSSDSRPRSEVHMYWTPVPSTITLPSSESQISASFITSIDTDQSTAREAFEIGRQFARGDLYPTHLEAWRKVWDAGRIEVEGNLDLQKTINGALYYILSSLPAQNHYGTANQFYGLSPGGLANGKLLQDYQGHSFWDTETWMYPPILLLHPALAKDILSYRIHVRGPAYDRARENGHQGLRFPWESAFTGVEVTPGDICMECRENQQHITGDIAFAARQYVSATRDLGWLKDENGWELIMETARFWKSRPTFNQTRGLYDINGVMPPDEFHHTINNSIYTNVVAKLSMEFANYTACLLGETEETAEEVESWVTDVGNKLYLPEITDENYHPEFEGYPKGELIKQADVILLGYPLMWQMSDQVRRSDLNIYEKVTDRTGPAMTWSMFCVGWLELQEYSKARQMFQDSYSIYVKEPFKVWTEAHQGLGAVNFITGMGGFLQAVLFGYGGFRLHVDRLDLNPVLPPDTDRMKIHGLDYLGSSLDVTVSSDVVTVNVTSLGGDYPLEIRAGDTSYSLQEGLPVQLPRGPASIATTRQDSNRCTPPVAGDGTAGLQGTTWPWVILLSLLVLSTVIYLILMLKRYCATRLSWGKTRRGEGAVPLMQMTDIQEQVS
ncbi:PREDICTED: acid trehalase-like protein 1 [Branchiostoma belcheri]|uniref:Protein-glucosylgalactosylhydroxylysine glucosidase n=1 Tax=Branchiostoma belcheri TaxID=7741 RepID=A0A6P5ACJ1_BRABE|nr:PREDICTED: acid trehalase-like protein 1 [Branchiostoma belcheri]